VNEKAIDVPPAPVTPGRRSTQAISDCFRDGLLPKTVTDEALLSTLGNAAAAIAAKSGYIVSTTQSQWDNYFSA
jgi:hypothetical protein